MYTQEFYDFPFLLSRLHYAAQWNIPTLGKSLFTSLFTLLLISKKSNQ